MFFLKFFYFLKGYVIIEVSGGDFARFVNICAARRIRLWNIGTGKVSVWERDFAKLRPVARKCGVKIHIAEKRSIKRGSLKNGGWFIFICAVLFLILMFISSQYVWSIEVIGCDAEKAAEVLYQAQQFGLCQGVKKSSLPDGNHMRDGIIYKVDGINWAWVYLDGTHARIEVSEDIPAPQMYNAGDACNITAVREGILTTVSAKSGRKMFAVGDRVDKGDIIISGAMPGGELTDAYTVGASGEVFAETVHTESCEYPLTKTYTYDTGSVDTVYWLRIFDLKIPLGFWQAPDFDEYRVERYTPPAGICYIKYIETESYTEPIPQETAVYEAKEALYEKIASSLQPGTSRTGEHMEYEVISPEKIKVTLTMSFIENIGVKTPIEQWQMEELADDKTD